MLQIQGDREVISRFGAVESAMGRMRGAGAQVASGTQAAAGALRTLSSNMEQVSSAVNRNVQATSRLGGVYNSAGQMVRGSASSFQSFTSALGSTTDAANQNARAMSLGRLAMDELRPRMTGLAISAVMLTNSVSEAAFMQEVLADAQKRTAEAQAELTRLEAQGAQGTVEYTRAKADLARAERAEAIFRRNAMQASMDQLNFIVLLGASLGPVIVKTAQWAREQVRATQSTTLLTKAIATLSLTNLRASFTAWTNSLMGVVSAQKVAVASTVTLADGTTRLATTQRLAATSAIPLNAAMAGTTRTGFAATGALTGLSAAFGTATVSSTAATGAMTRFGIALRALALNPLFLILTAVATVLTLVATNAFGVRDAFDSAGKAIGDAIPGLRGFLNGIRDLGEMMGIVPEETNEIGIAVSEATDRFNEMKSTLNGTMDSFDKFNTQVIDTVNTLTSVSNVMSGTMVQAVWDLGEALQAGVITQEEFAFVMSKIESSEAAWTAGMQEMRDATLRFSNDSEGGIMELISTVNNLPGSFADVAPSVRPHLDRFVSELDNTTLTTQQKFQLMTDVINGEVGPSFANLSRNGTIALGQIINYLNDAGNTAGDKGRVIAQIMRALGEDFMYVADEAEKATTVIDKVNAEFSDLVEQGHLIAEQLGHTGDMIGATEEDWALYALTVQKVSEHGLMAQLEIRAEALALQQLHPELQTSIDLKYDDIAAVQQQIDAWEEQLGTVEQVTTVIDDLNASYEESIAQGPRLVSQMENLNSVISEQERAQANLIEGTKQAIEARYADEDAIRQEAIATAIANGETSKFLQTLASSTAASQAYLNEQEEIADALEEEAKAAEKAAEAQREHLAVIADFPPQVRAAAQAFGLMDRAMLDSNNSLERQFDHLDNLNQEYDSARIAAEEFAITHGTSIPDAVNMTDQELLETITTFAELDAQQQITAKEAQKAAEEFARAWEAGLDKAVERLERTSSVLGSAMDDLFKRMNDKLDPNEFMDLSFMEDFWDRWFPAEIVEAKFEEAFDMDRLVDKVRNRIDNAVSKGLITEEQAERWFQPLQDYLREGLPEDSEEAFGAVVAKFGIFEDMLRPVMLGGVIEIGHELKQQIDSSMMQPMIEAVSNGEGMLGESFFETISTAAEQIGKVSPEVKGYIDAIMNDANLTTQEKVQALVATFDQISPGFRDTIMKIDRDMDGLPDILDKDIGKPFEDLKNAIVEAFQEILDKLNLLPEGVENTASMIETSTGRISTAFAGMGAGMSRFSEDMNGATQEVEGSMVRITQAGVDLASSASVNLGSVKASAELPKSGFDASAAASTSMKDIITGDTNELKTTVYNNAITIAKGMDAVSLAWKGFAGNVEIMSNQVAISVGDMVRDISGKIVTMQTTINTFASGFGRFSVFINQQLTNASIAWANHSTVVNTAITRLGSLLGISTTHYNAYRTNVGAILTGVTVTWQGHATAVNSAINRIGSLLGISTQHYNAYRNNIDRLLTQVTIIWQGHATAVNTAINRIGGLLGTSTSHYQTYRNNIDRLLTQVTIIWQGHATAVGTAASRLASSIEAMARRIIAANNSAINSLEALQDQIDSMHGKTITVTTVRRTVSSGGGSGGGSGTTSGGAGTGGRASASARLQHGFMGMFKTPTNITVAEGGGKEFVMALPTGRGNMADTNTLRSLLGSLRGVAGSPGRAEIVIISPIILDGREIGRVTRKHMLDGVGGFT